MLYTEAASYPDLGILGEKNGTSLIFMKFTHEYSIYTARYRTGITFNSINS